MKQREKEKETLQEKERQSHTQTKIVEERVSDRD